MGILCVCVCVCEDCIRAHTTPYQKHNGAGCSFVFVDLEESRTFDVDNSFEKSSINY